MKILGVHATDFCLFSEATVNLDKQGLVWVGGVNKDSDSAISNGAGKTSVSKAISWGLYGETLDGKDGDEVIRHGQKVATVVVRLSDGESTWKIVRARKKGSPRLELYCGEEKWSGGRQELQSKINQMIGVDFRGFRNTVMYGEGDRKRFVDPSTSDADRKALLAGVLNTDVLGVCHEWAKTQALILKRKSDALDRDASDLRSKLAEHDLEDLQQAKDAWEEERKRRVRLRGEEAKSYLAKASVCANLRVQAEASQKLADDIDESAAEVAKASRKAAQSVVDAAREAHSEARAAYAAAEGSVSSIQERLELADGDVCPVCTSPLTSGHAGEYVSSLKEALKAACEVSDAANLRVLDKAADLAAARKGLAAAEAEENTAGVSIARRAKLLSEVAKLVSESARDSEYTEEAKKRIAAAKAAKAEANPHAAALARSAEKVAEYTASVLNLKKESEETATDRAHYEFWARGFSGSGLPSFILDGVMPYITERACHYLELLSDGDMKMAFSTQKELKSSKGEIRDAISITWEIEGVQDYAPSKGQWRKMEIATDLALMDLVGTRVSGVPDVLILDEILDGLDAEGRARVARLLHELKKSRSTILVASHDESLADAFERSLVVVKKGGASTIVASHA